MFFYGFKISGRKPVRARSYTMITQHPAKGSSEVRGQRSEVWGQISEVRSVEMSGEESSWRSAFLSGGSWFFRDPEPVRIRQSEPSPLPEEVLLVLRTGPVPVKVLVLMVLSPKGRPTSNLSGPAHFTPVTTCCCGGTIPAEPDEQQTRSDPSAASTGGQPVRASRTSSLWHHQRGNLEQKQRPGGKENVWWSRNQTVVQIEEEMFSWSWDYNPD